MRKPWLRRAVVAAAVVLAGTGLAQAAEPIRFTAPVNLTKDDLDPQRTWAAPSLLVSPSDPNLMLAGMHEFRSKKCSLARSTDGGRTWTRPDADPSPASYPFCVANNSNIFHSNIAWGRDNRVYMAMVGWDTPDTRTKASVVVARSDDLGDSWETVVAHDARPTADPQQVSLRPITGIVVDTSGSEDTVYVSYRQQFQNQPSGSAPPVEPYIAVSTDGARTFQTYSALGGAFASADTRNRQLQATTTVPGFTPPTTVAGSFAATPDRVENFGSSTNGHGLTRDNAGNLYLAFPGQTFNNVTPGQPRGIFVSKSTDGGQTWAAVQAVPFSYENRQNTRIAWSPGGGSQGTLHVVWEAALGRPEMNQYSDLAYIRSTDGGQTWSQPSRIADDNPADLRGKYIPNITVAPNGRVDVAWWDLRDDPGVRGMDVYYAYSEDDGVTWSRNYRITDQTIDRRYGVWANNFDQNSPPGLASTNEVALVAWDDTRFSTGEEGQVRVDDPTNTIGVGGGVQDVFVSAVQFDTIAGGASRTTKILLAGLAGLLGVGLVLGLVTMVSRRQSGPAPTRTSPTEKAGVK
jgi:hypothetical protein